MSLQRLQTLDLARGLAVVLMIQTHAFDAWLTNEAKATWGYRVSRELGAIPAPAFLLLSGVSLALLGNGKLTRGVSERGARWFITRRGLEVVAYGYLLSLAYATLDRGWSVSTLFRADILHAIGLGLVTSAWFVWRRSRGFVFVTILVVLTTSLVWRAHVPAPPFLAPLVGLFVDVPGWTRFPVVPLVIFTFAGVLGARAIAANQDRALALLLACIAAAALFEFLTGLTVTQVGGTLSRSHPAVIFNILDGIARTGAVVACAALLGRVAAAIRLNHLLSTLGRHSLLAYAVHLPFCYSVFARAFAHQLNGYIAGAAFTALVAFTFGAAKLREKLDLRG